MAEEAQYSSGTESASLKRKYEDQPSERTTGFSAGPATGIELAKQRAQEVAARLLSGTPPPPLDTKRPKADNGAPTSGFDSYGNLLSLSASLFFSFRLGFYTL